MKTNTKATRKKGTKFAGAYVPDETHDNLAFIAAHEHRTVSDHIRKLIAAELEAQSDLLRKMPKPKRTSTK